MPPLRTPDINRFLNHRRPNWARLEVLLQRVEAEGLGSLSSAEVREFGILYRRTSSDLVTARAKTANAEILRYLNDLVARSYAQVYRTRRFQPRDVFIFLRLDFPRLFRYCGRYIALAAALSALATGFGWYVNAKDPIGAYYMLPPSAIKQMPVARNMWKNRSGHPAGEELLAPALSSFIMTHNIGIGLVAFAGGIFFGIGPLWAMLENGLMLGIFAQEMSRPGTFLVFWSLILPHGILELTAIFVMGGAGFVIAGALLAPGKRSRLDALIERGRVAVLLALGGGAMLVVAGLIEGFITPPEFIPPWAKLAFAGLTLVAEVLYFGLAGRGPEPGVLKHLLAYDDTDPEAPALGR